MMDRNQIIGILGQLPTDKLLKALSVVGSDTGGGDDLDMMGALSMDGGNNKIQSWNDRSVPYNGGGDRPAIADKKWAQGAGGVGEAQDPRMAEGLDDLGESNIFLQTGGGA